MPRQRPAKTRILTRLNMAQLVILAAANVPDFSPQVLPGQLLRQNRNALAKSTFEILIRIPPHRHATSVSTVAGFHYKSKAVHIAFKLALVSAYIPPHITTYSPRPNLDIVATKSTPLEGSAGILPECTARMWSFKLNGTFYGIRANLCTVFKN